jgi:hypothetical protein
MRHLGAICVGLVAVLSVLGTATTGIPAVFVSTEPLERLIRHRLCTLNARVGLYAEHVPTGGAWPSTPTSP